MPKRDGTGPAGMGKQKGRGLGNCGSIQHRTDGFGGGCGQRKRKNCRHSEENNRGNGRGQRRKWIHAGM